jgi:hypothetical protein
MSKFKDKLKNKHDKREEIKRIEEERKKAERETAEKEAERKKVKADLRKELEQEIKDQELKELQDEEKRVREKIRGFKLSISEQEDLIVKLIILTRDHRSIMKSMVDSWDHDIIKFCEND